MKKTAIPSLLLSAFLLFYVQPFIARLILPYFGSSASVWILCLAFFQILLLGGYLYTDRISRLSTRAQAVLHGGLVSVALLATVRLANIETLKSLASEAGASSHPVPALLWLLLSLIGPAYFALSTNGPLMQAWIGRESGSHIEKRTVYRFYALSNVGSFVGLFAYPLIVEPLAGIALQSRGFVVAFSVYALSTLAASVALLMKGAAGQLVDAEAEVEAASRDGVARPTDGEGSGHDERAPLPPSHSPLPTRSAIAANGEVSMWVFLIVSFVATFLLMAATQHLTIDIPPIPLLWAVLLGIYLLSFTLGFSATAVRLLPAMTVAALVLVPIEAYIATAIAGKRGISSFWQIGFCALLLLLGCLALNTWQYKLRPPQSRLPRFYLMLSIGGAAAGVFFSLVAPFVFSGTPEYPIALVATAVLLAWLWTTAGGQKAPSVGTLAIPPAVALIALLAGQFNTTTDEPVVWRARDFYGSIAIHRLEGKGSRGQPLVFHSLSHGNTSHGSQMWTAGGQATDIPLSCFSERSGIGLYLETVAHSEPQRVGIIGLGIGTLAAYGRRGDTFRYYEIAPLVLEAATNTTWFTFLRDTPSEVEHIIGDARLSMAEELKQGRKQNYDLIIADAFSSDAIPSHLLTVEAFRIYQKHLKPGGVISVNITNRYIDLLPVAKAAAKALGWHFKAHVSQGQGMLISSTWVFLSPEPIVFDAGPFGAFVSPETIQEIRPWTDDDYSIWPLIMWH
ncbi:MAG: fused MFS/spermidine synthase [Desulfuromonadaceae bacterium]|nr:fused MFS/spermidine synthase [Desulfuromonadaceae bacterium]